MSDDNVEILPVVTSLACPAERILKAALDANMKDVIVLGFDENDNLYFSASNPDAGNVFYHLEMARHRLIKICNMEDE